MLAIHVVDGDWGGALLTDIHAVASSADSTFDAVDDDQTLEIVLKPKATEDAVPWTYIGSSGERVIELTVRGNLWARLAYQFAHEFCHVLANVETWPGWDHFAWLEEALCEAGSLFALRSMASGWVLDPPHENWRDYSSSLDAYVTAHMAETQRSLPPEISFVQWLAGRLPVLQADARRHEEDRTIIAKELLGIFESWRTLRYLHTWPRTNIASLGDFFAQWPGEAPACGGVDRPGDGSYRSQGGRDARNALLTRLVCGDRHRSRTNRVGRSSRCDAGVRSAHPARDQAVATPRSG